MTVLSVSLVTASSRIGIPVRTLRAMSEAGTFPARKVGRRWLVAVDALEAWYRKHIAPPTNVVEMRRPA